MPIRWSARGVGRQWPAAQVSLERVACALGLGARQRRVLGDSLGRRVLGAVRLDHIAADTVLAELRLDHAQAARRMAVTLLAPPAGECGVVDVAELDEAIERRHEDRLLRTGASQASFELPACPRASAEEPGRDLHGGLGTWGLVERSARGLRPPDTRSVKGTPGRATPLR